MQEMRHQLEITQTQKLVMTQSLRQQLEMLQLSSLELEALIRQELSDNPLLEEVDPLQQGADEPDQDSPDQEAEEEPTRQDETEEDTMDILRQLEEDSGEYPSGGSVQEEDLWRPEPESRITLSEHLIRQVQHLGMGEGIESAAAYVIYSLDRHGLLCCGIQELLMGWGGDPELLYRALVVVRGLEPQGVGQQSAEDVLKFQLKARGYAEDSLEFRILSEHFDDLASRRIPAIARALGVTPSRIEEASKVILSLNPWPGADFSPDTNTVVIPDLIIDRADDNFVVFLNDNRFPRLHISERNRRVLESPSTSSVERDYVKTKFKRAGWFIRAISQRQDTVLRIGRFLVEAQGDFLLHGLDYLRPLTLQQAADALGNNASTISRAINGKYVQSPQGIHEMKFYFSRAAGSGETDTSAARVREEIKRLVSHENPSAPLSDERLSAILSDMGMPVKRRTVANYRMELGIESARRRRRF